MSLIQLSKKDGVTRGYKLLTGNGYVVERPLQLLCDLEISGTSDDSRSSVEDAEHSGDIIETGANQRRPQRPEREARRTAVNRLVGVVANENEED